MYKDRQWHSIRAFTTGFIHAYSWCTPSLLKYSCPGTNTFWSWTVKTSDMWACFALVDKEYKLSDPWRCVILRKVHKSMWEVLDELWESVFDTIKQSGEEGLIDLWWVQSKHPTMYDYERSDQNRKALTKARADMLRESPVRKCLHDDAHEALRNPGRQMKKGYTQRWHLQFKWDQLCRYHYMMLTLQKLIIRI